MVLLSDACVECPMSSTAKSWGGTCPSTSGVAELTSAQLHNIYPMPTRSNIGKMCSVCCHSPAVSKGMCVPCYSRQCYQNKSVKCDSHICIFTHTTWCEAARGFPKQIKMAFTLPALPYDYAALEPYVDATTMNIHHTKHHQVDQWAEEIDPRM